MTDLQKAAEIELSARKTMRNFRHFVIVQRMMFDINMARQSPMGCVIAPRIENQMYDDMVACMEAGQA